jgi:hypothetical protein
MFLNQPFDDDWQQWFIALPLSSRPAFESLSLITAQERSIRLEIATAANRASLLRVPVARIAGYTILIALATVLAVWTALTALLRLIVAAADDPGHTARSRTFPAMPACEMADDSTTQTVLQASTGLRLGCAWNCHGQRHGGKGNSDDSHATELHCVPTNAVVES